MKIYLNEFIHPDAASHLRSQAEVVTNFDHIEELDGIIVRGTQVTGEMIRAAKNLKVIGRHGIAMNIIDLDAARECGVRVLNTPRTNANSVAEYIVGCFLAMSRHFYECNVKLRRGAFTRIAPPDLLGSDVSGKTVGLVGMGNISQLVAKIMRNAFDCEICGYDPFVDNERAAALGFKKYERLEDLLEVSDLVNISVPLSKGTVGLVSGDMFRHFKPGAILVNAARGQIVNEDGLYCALTEGPLKAAAFDTFAVEPLPKDSKLLTLENFSATPHIGGNTEEALYRTGMAVVDNVINVIKGQPADGIIV